MNAQEIKGNWDQIRGKVKEKWGQLTDDDLKVVEGNIEQVVGRIQQKTGEARRNVEQFLDGLVDEGSEKASKVMQSAGEYVQAATHSAQESMRRVADQAREGYQRAGEVVQHHPTQSMAAVFGFGFLAGIFVGVMMHSDN